MAYTGTDLAKISKVSVRTLRWHDQIGLLKPAYIGANSYRYYVDAILAEKVMHFMSPQEFKRLLFERRML